MRSGIDGPFAILSHSAAGKNHLSGIVGGFEFKPDIERIYRTSGEEMADLSRTDNNSHAIGFSRRDLRLHSVKRCDQGTNLSRGRRHVRFSLLTDRKRGGEVSWRRATILILPLITLTRRGDSKDIHGQNAVLEELRHRIQLFFVLINGGQCSI